MQKIGITGNIASGKSEVEKIISQQGFKVFCADKASHATLEKPEIKSQILEIFPPDEILENGTISRKKLGYAVFSNTELKKKLENIIHPEVINEINTFFKHNENEKFVFASVPLLFECNLACLFDKIIFISADKNLRHSRILKRDGHSSSHATQRINSQDDEAKKIKQSDFIIKNNGTLEELKQKTLEILEKLI